MISQDALSAREAIVNRVVLRLPPGIAPHEQRRWRGEAERALSYATLTPGGLPPHAILVVRRLADPQPGGLWQGAAWMAGNRWGQQARRALEDVWRAAARPFYENVPSNAQAVWFTDVAEWLACLSLDLQRGIAAQQWWWKTWLRQLNAQPSALATLWREEARWLPSALAALHRWDWQVTADIVAALTHGESNAVRTSLAHAYRLPTELVQSGLKLGEWARYIPVGAESLPSEPEAAQLLALALVLHYAPAAAPTMTPGNSASTLRMRDSMLPPTFEEQLVPDDETHMPSISIKPGQTPNSDGYLSADDMAQDQIPDGQSSVGTDGNVKSVDGQGDEEGYVEQPASALIDRQQATADSVPRQDRLQEGITDGISTALGGAWYLLNALITLNLLAPTDMLGPWLKLRALALELLGPEPPQDALWEVLEDIGNWIQTDSSDLDAEAHRWLTLHLPAIGDWLSGTLGDDKPLASYFTQPATLYVTRTHVDVMFSLEAIDLSIRIAGLDRNPGWVPELGRIITFHYV